MKESAQICVNKGRLKVMQALTDQMKTAHSVQKLQTIGMSENRRFSVFIIVYLIQVSFACKCATPTQKDVWNRSDVGNPF